MRPLQREETTKVPAMRGSPVSWVRDTARVTLQHSQKGLQSGSSFKSMGRERSKVRLWCPLEGKRCTHLNGGEDSGQGAPKEQKDCDG